MPSYDSVTLCTVGSSIPATANAAVCEFPAPATARLPVFNAPPDAQVPIGAPPSFTVLNCPVVEL